MSKRAVVSLLYELPFGKHPGFASKVIGGWQLNTIGIMQTGIPLLIRGANNMNVSISAAGFNAGAASITANDGPNFDDRSYIPENTGATQHEQSIKGAPASPAASCDRTRPRLTLCDNQRGGSSTRTAPLIRMPNSSAGQMTEK